MSLRKQIEADFLIAYKARNEVAKSSLKMLKTKLTEAEKANGNKELTDSEILKVILSSVKQRKQSIDEYQNAGREDLVLKEQEELKVLEAYMPSQLSEQEIRVKLSEILETITASNKNQKIGMAMGAMNKQYSGQFDSKLLSSILNEIVI